MWLIILLLPCKTLLNSGDSCQLASISKWITVHRIKFRSTDSHSEVTSLTQVAKPEGNPVVAAALSMDVPTQNDQFSFPDMCSFRLK